MKTITGFSSKQVLISLVVIHLFSSYASGQETKEAVRVKDQDSEWWLPILTKHKMDVKASNTFKNIFEMGATNSIENGVCKLTDAVLILRDKSGTYSIIESPIVVHDFNRNTIIAGEGTIKVFRQDSDISHPLMVFEIHNMELTFPKN